MYMYMYMHMYKCMYAYMYAPSHFLSSLVFSCFSYSSYTQKFAFFSPTPTLFMALVFLNFHAFRFLVFLIVQKRFTVLVYPVPPSGQKLPKPVGEFYFSGLRYN